MLAGFDCRTSPDWLRREPRSARRRVDAPQDGSQPVGFLTIRAEWCDWRPPHVQRGAPPADSAEFAAVCVLNVSETPPPGIPPLTHCRRGKQVRPPRSTCSRSGFAAPGVVSRETRRSQNHSSHSPGVHNSRTSSSGGAGVGFADLASQGQRPSASVIYGLKGLRHISSPYPHARPGHFWFARTDRGWTPPPSFPVSRECRAWLVAVMQPVDLHSVDDREGEKQPARGGSPILRGKPGHGHAIRSRFHLFSRH